MNCGEVEEPSSSRSSEAKYGETRYIRDLDGYIIEVGQSNPGVAYG
jgi:hypothetical protein